MYAISDIVEMGQAHELVLNLIKPDVFAWDDAEPYTMPIEEHFDD